MQTNRPPIVARLWWRVGWGSALLTFLIWATVVLIVVVAEGIADPGPICYDRNPGNEVWCD